MMPLFVPVRCDMDHQPEEQSLGERSRSQLAAGTTGEVGEYAALDGGRHADASAVEAWRRQKSAIAGCPAAGSIRCGMGGLPLYSPICAQTVTLRVICDAPALRQRNRSRLWKLNVLHHQKAPTSLRRVRTLPYVGFRRAPRVSCSINALAIPEGRFVHPRQRDRG
jgi:hypothetical protein